jgi:hypothetical protein
MSWATVRYQCPNCREVTEIPDVPEALIKGDLGDIDRICPTCGVDLEVLKIRWDQNDKDLADLDWVTITVTWQDGTKAETTVTPEEAWDILNREKPFVTEKYERPEGLEEER